MSRPKGSRNKKKEEPKEVIKVDPKPVETVKQEPKNKLVGHPLYVTKPDMGDIKPPSEKEKVCSECGDLKAFHYGGSNDWCNKNGCVCKAFK